MFSTLIELFDNEFEHVKFDKKLAKSIYDYQFDFVNKNEDHMLFFGGVLLGVQTVRFNYSDYNKFFDQVLNVSSHELINGIKKVPGVNTDWAISSNEFNITCMYLVYRFLTETSLDKDIRVKAAKDVLTIFQYRAISSMLAWYFKYPASVDTAEATYNALSMKFLIKKLGSWQKVIEYISNEMLVEDGTYYKELLNFKDDVAVTDVINALHNRDKGLIKNIYAVYMDVHNSGAKINAESTTEVTLDGEEIIRDRLHGIESYITYLNSIIGDKRSFIREELLEVVVDSLTSVSEKYLRNTLSYISDQSHGPQRATVNEFINKVMVYTISYLRDQGNFNRQLTNVAQVVIDIRNLFTASRSNDIDLRNIRKLGEKLVRKENNKLRPAAVAQIRTGLIIYLCLRAFTKNSYH